MTGKYIPGTSATILRGGHPRVILYATCNLDTQSIRVEYPTGGPIPRVEYSYIVRVVSDSDSDCYRESR